MRLDEPSLRYHRRRVSYLAHRCLTALAFGACFFAPRLGSAHPPLLQWDAPAECPQGEEVARSVVALAPAHVDEDEHRFRGVVEKVAENSWRIEITQPLPPAVEHPSGGHPEGSNSRRVVEGSTCSEVTDAAITILAMTLSPPEEQSVVPASPPKTEGPSAEEEPPETETHSSTPPQTSRQKEREPWLLRLGSGAELTTLPHPSPWFEAVVGLPLGPLLLELGGGYALPQERASVPPTRIALLTGTLSLCYRLHGQKLFWGTCVSGQAGVSPGRATGENGKRSMARIVALGGTLELGYHLSSHLALHLGMGAFGHLLRDSFLVGKTQSYQIARTSLRPTLGVEFQFR